MSVRLSVTTMTSMDTMLKVATPTIIMRMSDIMVFFDPDGPEAVGVVLVSSRNSSKPGGSLWAQFAA